MTAERRITPFSTPLLALALTVLLSSVDAAAQPATAASASAAADPAASAQPAQPTAAAEAQPPDDATPPPPASGPPPATPPPGAETAPEEGYGPPLYGPPHYDGGEYGQPYGYPPGSYGPPLPRKEPEPKRKFHSVGMMVSGIVLSALGGLNAIAGLSLVASAEDNRACASRSCLTPEESRAAGIGAMVAGGVLMGVGLPLLIVGAQREPVEEGVDPAEYGRRGGAILTLGPAGAVLSATF